MKASILALAIAASLAAQAGLGSLALAQVYRPEEAFGPASGPASGHGRGAAHKARKVKKKKSDVAPKAAKSAPALAPAAPAAAPAPTMPVPAPAATMPAPAAKAPASRDSGGITYSTRHAAAIDLALSGDARGSIEALRGLLAEDADSAQKNEVRLSLGRVLYGLGDVNGAIAAYAQVERGSESWYLALEERAWANLRIDRPEDALASIKTLLLPLFKDRVGPEPYFLGALIYLRICDYKSAFKTIRAFKEAFRDRVRDWEFAADSDPAARARLRVASETIQKLSLVEAEAIQRLYMPDEIKGHVGPERKITRARDEMKFPETTNKELWLDEVDGKQVSVKGCPRPGTTGVAGGSTSGRGGRDL
jgi:tetratricopeptide (TPR) repeat protein